MKMTHIITILNLYQSMKTACLGMVIFVFISRDILRLLYLAFSYLQMSLYGRAARTSLR